MKQRTTFLLFLSCLPAAPVLAQAIGGGTCSSANLSGVYAVSVTSRQVTASGTFTGVLQSNGTATFDGQSAASFKLVANTGLGVATPLTWSGTYSVQANCAGVINITSGGNATWNVALYKTGTAQTAYPFLLSGSDANYTYSGSGTLQPATACSASTFSGVYTFTGTGFSLMGSAVSGVENGAGLLQFDGVSAVTANFTMWTGGAAPSTLVLTGSYSVSAFCMGSATLTDASNNSYAMSFSVYNDTVANAASYAGLELAGKFLITGSLHTAYGQPSTAEMQLPSGRPVLSVVAKPLGGSAHQGGRS
ncbi:MAG: hypothetical protein ACLQGV_19810 [Bryobacteraceae bacterium]